jgi:hypothetical protein
MPKAHDDMGHKYCLYLGIRYFFSIKTIRSNIDGCKQFAGRSEF